MGTIVTDRMERDGHSTLALSFTQAQVKGGQAIPIEVTIVGLPGPEYGADWSDGQNTPALMAWNGTTLQVDESGIVSGLDLHSSIAGNNSATFVSKKDDVKLQARTQLSLAIGAQNANTMHGGA